LTAPEVSVVIPCLDEEEAIASVVREARDALEAAGESGEVVVVDNGSTDASAERAREAGARVVFESRRGYGSAYLAGIEAARGRYLVLTDGDGTYDLSRLGDFVSELRGGADLVVGSRLKGRIEPGGMPWTHRWIGNPILTAMLNLLFRIGISDAQCGLRALSRDAAARLDLQATGMEFVSETSIKAAKRGLTVREIPIVYRPRIGESKLSGVPDAWRNVRFMLVHSPTWLFFVPGVVALLVGFATLVPLAVDRHLGDPSWTVPVAILASFLIIVGAQALQLGVSARTYATLYLGDDDPQLRTLWRRIRLEHGLAIAGATTLAGIVIALVANFDGVPDPALGLLGVTLVALGVQGVFGSFLLSILGLSEHARIVLDRRQPPSIVLVDDEAAGRDAAEAGAGEARSHSGRNG
jgi:hypothetical protein